MKKLDFFNHTQFFGINSSVFLFFLTAQRYREKKKVSVTSVTMIKKQAFSVTEKGAQM